MNSSPTNHEQFTLPSVVSAPELTGDFVSTGNTTRTDKNFIVKDFVVVNDTETSLLHGMKLGFKIVPSVYPIALRDFLLVISSVAVAPTLTLPKASQAGRGKIYMVRDISGSALTTSITIAATGTDKINGETTTAINTNYGSQRFISDGSNWFIY